MKRILTILFFLVSLTSHAQLLGDTVKVVTNASHEQWFSSPYGVHKILAFSKIGFRPASYPAYLSLPTGLKTGELVWVEDSVRYAYWNSSAWVLMTPDGLGGVAGVSSFNTRTGAVTLQASDVSGVGGFVNGLNAFGANSTIGNSDNFALSIRTNNAARINITNAGAVSLPDGNFTVGGTTNGVINIQSSAASTRGSIDLSSNNPRLNSATGTWLFSQSGNTVGLYNATGFFFGGGTVPSGFVVGILAGTTTNAPLRFNSGPLTTTAVAGNEEFLTDKRYTTITTGAVRKEYALWDAAGTSGRVILTTTNGRLTDLAPGTDGHVLTLASGVPVWSAPAGSTTIYTGDGTLSGNRSVLGAGNFLSLGTSGSKLLNLTAHASDDINLNADDRVTINAGLSTKVTVATDADMTLTTNMMSIVLPDITANRTLTLPSVQQGMLLIIHNQNSNAFAWNISGVLHNASNGTISALTNDQVYMIQGIDDGSTTYWKVVSIQN